ncbi:MAG: PIG-L family deacetylase [Actinobacteria bacterium]|nr:PIG-L family deacetylase [Actinomycetota bacterium]
MPATVAFFHAHPDDEAIFTGGTIRRLVDDGARVVIVFATTGEGGEGGEGADPAELAARRTEESRTAAAALGVEPDGVAFLGYRDSGIGVTLAPGMFAGAPLERAAASLADLLEPIGVDALVIYDPHGIYGHADHVQVHRVGWLAAELAAVDTVYECTVDREYLHFVETHLVERARESVAMLVGRDGGAGGAGALGLAGTSFGLPSVLIDATVDVRSVLAAKRAAMLAHESQIPAESSTMQLDSATFAEVYGYEWYTRTGPRGPIDVLA